MKENDNNVYFFRLPEEEVLSQKIAVLDEGVVSSSILTKIGFFRHGGPIDLQIKAWGVPVFGKTPFGKGHIYLFEKSDIMGALGSSRMLPLRILLSACGIQHGNPMVAFTKSIRRSGIEILQGEVAYIGREHAIRIYQEHLKTKSSGSAVKPDRNPSVTPNSASPAPPESSVGVDHLRRMAETLLSFAQYSKDLMERCESLLEKVSDDFETQRKANRVLFRMADEHKTALGKIMASFEISTE